MHKNWEQLMQKHPCVSDVLTCFDTDKARELTGKLCYFSDDTGAFSNLRNITLSVLTEIDDRRERCFCAGKVFYKFVALKGQDNDNSLRH